MNARCYKTVFSKRLGARVAVGEHASSQGKATGASSSASTSGQSPCSDAWAGSFWGALSSTFALVALVWATPAWAQPAANALPTGGQVVQGAVQFNQSAQQLNITQNTDRAAINWQSFDIGAAAKVNIQQPSAQSVLLNRVGGESPSQIFGQLQANGQVILVNPNGMVFGKDGSVSAAGFTGSTLNISDADFMAGKERYTRSGTAASTSAIVNRGLIQAAPGGYVALLGASVSNEGRIEAPQGNVFMAAADAVTLPSHAPTLGLPIGQSGRIRLELTPASINAAVANHKGGTIVTEGGQVYLQAAALNQAMATVLQSGIIDTTGVQGGQVHVLADGGRIRVDGQIKANSTGTDNKGQTKAGGDIYIGRDKDTNVLADVGDVRGAQLESKGGFVETSGQYLATTGTRVTAKEWLLDPTDIIIVATGTTAPDTASATTGNTTTFQDSSGISASEVLKSTIETAINNGTSVTISTANPTVGANGAGDITIGTALSFNNTGAQAATLSLFAVNGITQNTGATITATGSQLVHISMTANGNFQGVDAASTSSQGIILNAGITTNGNVTLSGTNKNPNGSSRGVNFANNSGITADTITVTGTATGAAEWNQGVFFHGTSSIRATGTGSSLISGISSSTAGAINSAVVFNDGSNVTLDGGPGSLTVQGTHTVGGYGGIRFGAYGGSSTNPSLTTRGNVTLGTQDANNASMNASFMLRGGLITADTGSLTIRGQGTGTGVNLFDGFGTISSNGGSITLNGVATSSGHGVLFNSNQVGTLNSGGNVAIIGTSSGNGNSGVNFNGGNVRVFGNNVTINGTANTTSGQTSYGFRSILGPGAGNTITAAGNLSITGAVNGAGSGTAVFHTSTNWQNLVNAYTAGGTLNITGTNNATAANTSATITMAGVQARAGGDLTVSATTNNAATDAISIFSNSYLSGGVAPGYQGGASSFVSTGGNTVIQSNQGSILIQDGVPNSVTSTAITGQNVIIDNTGGTFTEGVFTAGNGTSTRADRAGVQITDNLAGNDLHLASNTTRRIITASDANGQIVLSGKSTSSSASSQGVRIGSTVSFVAPTTSVLGTSTASNGISTTAAIAASGQIGLTGERTNATPGVGLNLEAAITTTGTSSTTTLTSTTGAVSGTGNITTAAGNTGTITVNTATAGTLSGVISGGGSLVKQGAGTTTLTGTNTYSGTTTISAGTLQIGNGGTTGSLGTNTGDITNNGTLAFNRSNALTVANAIIGTGALTQSGTGATTLTGTNTYAGTTTISAGTLQIGNGGSTGTLGNGGVVTLSNGANLNFVRNVSTSIDNDISGNGNVSANITGTGSNLALNSSIELAGATGSQANNAILSTAGSITQSVGSITATNLFLTATSGGIGTLANRINSNVSNLALTSAGDQFVTQQGAVNLAARTTGTGNIDARTTNGTMRVTSVNSVNGVTATGTAGSITLVGTTTTGHGININQVITANNGNVSLTGSTATTTGGQAGIFSTGAVSGRNITMLATATALTGNVLGYYGGGGTFTASEVLTLTGQSVNANGLYSYQGGYQSGTSMTLVGTSVNGSGVGMDNNVLVTNTGAGGITITGTASATRDAIGMGGVAITNTAGDVVLTATTGDIGTSVGNPGAWGGVNRTNTITNSGSGKVEITAGNGSATSTGLIDGTVFAIMQNGNGGVIVTTSGTGHVTAPKIINAGTGNVTVAAGTQLAAGDGTGGQVKTVSGNTISQTNATPGKTYIYTGNGADTGVLSNLGVFGTDLYLSTIGANTKNAASNRAYSAGPMTDGANAQVMFRERITLDGVVLNTATITYGDSTGSANLKAAMLTANPSTGTGSGVFSQATASNAGKFNISLADLAADSTGNANAASTVASNKSSSGNLKANTTSGYVLEVVGNDYNLTNVTAKLMVERLALTGSIAASSSTYGSTLTTGGVTLSNKVGADDVSAAGVSIATAGNTSTSGNLRAGSYTGIQSVSGLNGTDRDNYTFADVKGDYTVDRLALTGSIASGNSTYGAPLTTGAVTLSNKVGADDVSAAGVSIATAGNTSTSGNLRAGSYTGIQSVSGLNGTDKDNYTFADVKGDYTVDRLVLTSSIAAVSTVYGTAATTGAVAVSAGLLGDDVRVSPTATATLVGAVTTGSGKLAAGSYQQSADAALVGVDAGNYTTAPTTVANYVVTPKAITATVTAANKVYDGTTTATMTANSAGIEVGDQVTVQGVVGTFASKNVVRDGTGNAIAQAVTMSGTGVGLAGADGANYTLTNATNITATTAIITPVTLTGTIAAVTTTYGTNAATGAVSLGGVIAGDTVNASAAALVGGTLSSSGNLNAGSYTQTANSTLTGADAVNYNFAGVTAANSFTVAQRAITTASIAGVNNAVYSTNVAAGAVSLGADVIIGDQVAAANTATVQNRVTSTSGNLNAGSYTQSVAGGLVSTNGTTDAANYTFAGTTTAAANYIVTPRVINASVTAADKVYDGSAAATLVANSADVLSGDVVNVTGLTGSFASRNVARDGAGNVLAQAVTVSGSGAALGGADGANYVLGNSASVPATTARITSRDLSVGGITASDKVYDGNPTAVVSAVNALLSNVVSGDSVAVSTQNAQGNFADKDVARGGAGQVLAKTVQISGLQLQGPDAGNYTLTNTSATSQASITPRTLRLSGNTALDKLIDGNTTAQVRAGSLSGLVAGESLNVNAQGEFEDALVGNNKPINARFALQDSAAGLASNYQLINPVEVLRASILALPPVTVEPGRAGGGGASSGRISFSGGSGTGAATGVSDELINPELVEQCSVLNPEKCECEDTKIPGVEMCFAPTPLASLKD